MILLGFSVVQFLIHAEIGNVDVELTDHLFVLNRLLLQLLADLLEQFNLVRILSDSFLVPSVNKMKLSLFQKLKRKCE